MTKVKGKPEVDPGPGPEPTLNPDPVALALARDGDWVMWRSYVSRMIKLRQVVRSDEKLIFVGDHLCFDRTKGKCRSEFRHGHLIEPSRDHRMKYVRQRSSAERTDRIHAKRLDNANMEHQSEIQTWALETVRDLDLTDSEGERVEILLAAALKRIKML